MLWVDPLKREILLPCIAVLARGLRGIDGVRWLTTVVGGIDPATGPRSCQNLRSTFRWLAARVHKEFQQECERRGGDHKWAAHAEGRHVGLSGKFFVSCLVVPGIVDLLSENARKFQGKFGKGLCTCTLRSSSWAQSRAMPQRKKCQA